MGGENKNILKKKTICSGGVLKSVHIHKKTQKLGLLFVWDRVLVFENSSRFSWEPPWAPTV